MTQYNAIEKALRQGKRTTMDLIQVAGTTCPHKRLGEMRARGWQMREGFVRRGGRASALVDRRGGLSHRRAHAVHRADTKRNYTTAVRGREGTSMRTMIIALAIVAGNAIAGEIVVETDSYRVTGHDCSLDYMTWVEPPGRNLGKVGARGCSHYTVIPSGRPKPAQMDAHVTVSLPDLRIQRFECIITGISNDPEQIDVWCMSGMTVGDDQ